MSSAASPIDDQRWRHVRRLFLEVSTLDPAARDAWLHGVEDTAVAGAVRRLLSLHDELTGSDAGLDAVPVADALAAAFERAEQQRDDAIAEFRIERVIGEGGMGRVYLASREVGGATQRVALKIVPYAVHGPRIVEQLRRERAILAGLNHPNIARLIDAGELPDNRPYFAMEYVDGVPVTRYCDEARLDLRTRIALFLDVCDAVAYAHRQLVLHRDLKPNNILADADGRVRLLDFGIAKSLEGAEPGRETTLGGSFFSLRAAAPEQVLGRATSVATDVYGLGCLLHELLAGCLPFDFAERSREDIVRLIVEQPPALASAAVLACAQADAAAANRQLAGGRALAAALRGDLDAILAKSLRKDPAERYRSVDALAAELRNVLDFRPIAARASERWYRTRMLLRRHRVTALVAGVLGLAVIATTALSVAQSLRAEAERDRAVAALANAQLQRDHAQRVTDFLVNAFRAADPGKGRGTELRAGELLDQAAKTLEQDSAALDAALHATLAQTLAHIFFLLERAPDAVRQADIARAQMEKIADAPIEMRVRQDLADAGSAFLQQHFADAAETAQHGLGRIDDAAAFPDGSLLHALWDLRLRAEISRGSNAAVLALADDAIAMLSTRSGLRPGELDWLHLRRASALAGAGQPSAVVATLKDVVVEQRAGNRIDDANHVESLRLLAQAYTRQYEFLAAAPLYEEAMRKHLALYGEDSVRTPALLGGMASTYAGLGRKSEAIQLYRRAITLGRRHYGDVHNFVGGGAYYLAERYDFDFADRKQAEYWLRASLRAYPPEARGNRAMSERRLGQVLLAQGKTFEAVHHLRLATSELLAVYGYGDQLEFGRIQLAYAHLRRYEFDEAAALVPGSLLHAARTIDRDEQDYAEPIAQADEMSAFFGWNRASDGSTIVPPLRR